MNELIDAQDDVELEPKPSTPKFNWQDISDELYRTYVFPGGHEIRVAGPSKVAIKPPAYGSAGGGSHRVVDVYGSSHYISYGWLAIRWKVKDGKEPFSF